MTAKCQNICIMLWFIKETESFPSTVSYKKGKRPRSNSAKDSGQRGKNQKEVTCVQKALEEKMHVSADEGFFYCQKERLPTYR